MLSLSSLTAMARRKYRHRRRKAAASRTVDTGKETVNQVE